ncbi:MAG: L-lactate MFS transporter [Thermoproteota archaeon]
MYLYVNGEKLKKRDMRMEERWNRRVIVVTVGFVVNLMLGIVYAWSVFVNPLMNTYSWSKTDATLPFTVFLLVFAITMVPAGKLQDLKGPRTVAMAGGFLLGLGFILSSLIEKTSNIWLLVVMYGVISGAGCGFGYAAPIPCTRKWFPRRPGLAVGLVVMGFGMSTLLFAPLETVLIKEMGISKTFLIFGILLLTVSVTAAFFLENPPRDLAIPVSGANTGSAIDYTFREMVKTPQFYILWVMFFFMSTAGLMVIGHVAAFAGESGMDPIVAAFAASVLSLFNAFGRPGSGIISDKMGRTKTMFILFLVQALMMSILIKCTTMPTLYLAVAVIGFIYGANFSLFPSAIGDLYGVKNIGVNYGLLFTSYGAGGVLGPILGGYFFDVTGSYYAAFQTAAILCLIAAVMGLLIKPFKRQ